MRKLLSLALALLLSPLPSTLGEAAPERFAGLRPTSDQPGLYLLSPEPLPGLPSAVAVHGTQALTLLTAGEPGLGATLTLWDALNGQALATVDIPGQPESEGLGQTAGFLADGRPYLIDLSSLALTIYDQALRPELSFTPPEGAAYYEPLLSPLGDWLWAASLTGEELVGYRVDGGQTLRFRSPLPGSWRFAGFNAFAGDAVQAVFLDDSGHRAVHRYEPASGQLHVQPLLDDFTSYGADGWLFRLAGAVALFARVSDQQKLLRVAAWQREEYPVHFQGDLVISQNTTGLKLRLYDLARGLLLGEVLNPAAYTYYGFDLMALSDAGFALLSDCDYDAAVTRLYLWDYSLRPLDTPVGLRETSFEDLAGDNDALAAEIGAEHGVQVHIREAGAAFINPVYQAGPCLDDLALARALEDLRDFLNDLPPGLPAAALTPAYAELAFYLSGPILPRGEEGIASASGLSAEHEQERYIIIDANDSDARGNLAHEFMHLLEDSLLAYDERQASESLARFERLSPPDWDSGGYNWGYRMDDGMEMHEVAYTAQAEDAEKDPGSVYYIDPYSRSLPIEDRARIFEYLFTGRMAENGLLQYPHLLRKARYLAALLRQAFPQIQQPPIWEADLDQPADGEWYKDLILALPDAA